MKVGAENKKQLYIAGGLGFVALLALYPLYQELFGGASAPAAAVAPVVQSAAAAGSAGSSASTSGGNAKTVSAPPGFVVGGDREAQRVGAAGARLDPTLHMEGMLVTEAVVYTGTGRNIFAAGPAETTVVKVVAPIAPPRPPTVVGGGTQQVVNNGPPPPPPINLKFFGTATSESGVRRAFLLNGDDVFLASAGDVVQRRYRVVSISANSIQVEDLPNSNKQTLPLLPN